MQIERHRDRRLELRLQELRRLVNECVEIDCLGASFAAAGEEEQLLGERLRTCGRLLDLLEIMSQSGVALRHALERERCVAPDPHQQAVEVVGDSAGELADRLELLGLAQLLLERIPRRDVAHVPDDAVDLAHAAVKRRVHEVEPPAPGAWKRQFCVCELDCFPTESRCCGCEVHLSERELYLVGAVSNHLFSVDARHAFDFLVPDAVVPVAVEGEDAVVAALDHALCERPSALRSRVRADEPPEEQAADDHSEQDCGDRRVVGDRPGAARLPAEVCFGASEQALLGLNRALPACDEAIGGKQAVLGDERRLQEQGGDVAPVEPHRRNKILAFAGSAEAGELLLRPYAEVVQLGEDGCQ